VDGITFVYCNQQFRHYLRQSSQMEEILTKSSGHVSFVGLNNCKDDFATWWMGFMEGRTPGSGIQEG
jgi:hypothetical protein